MLKWPIRQLCDPIGHYPPVFFPLGDGTNIYRGRGKGPACFRGKRKKRCRVKCLPFGSLVASPGGPIAVGELQEGGLVWTFDLDGNRVARPVESKTSTIAGEGHMLVEIHLSDGRVVRASGPHPTALRQLADVEIGGWLDGARVREIRLVPLQGSRTFDFMPGGESGLYIVDGVILGSSLSE